MSPHERTVQVSRPIMPKRKLREYWRQPLPSGVTSELLVRMKPPGGGTVTLRFGDNFDDKEPGRQPWVTYALG